MIDGESSKAELLQKVLIWRYDCSYSDAYLIKTSPTQLHYKSFYWRKHSEDTEDTRRSSVTAKCDHSDTSDLQPYLLNDVLIAIKNLGVILMDVFLSPVLRSHTHRDTHTHTEIHTEIHTHTQTDRHTHTHTHRVSPSRVCLYTRVFQVNLSPLGCRISATCPDEDG